MGKSYWEKVSEQKSFSDNAQCVGMQPRHNVASVTVLGSLDIQASPPTTRKTAIRIGPESIGVYADSRSQKLCL